MWDLRKNGLLYKMAGHTDSITGLRLSPDGSYVVSNCMDNTGEIGFCIRGYDMASQ